MHALGRGAQGDENVGQFGRHGQHAIGPPEKPLGHEPVAPMLGFETPSRGQERYLMAVKRHHQGATSLAPVGKGVGARGAEMGVDEIESARVAQTKEGRAQAGSRGTTRIRGRPKKPRSGVPSADGERYRARATALREGSIARDCACAPRGPAARCARCRRKNRRATKARTIVARSRRCLDRRLLRARGLRCAADWQDRLPTM